MFYTYSELPNKRASTFIYFRIFVQIFYYIRIKILLNRSQALVNTLHAYSTLLSIENQS